LSTIVATKYHRLAMASQTRLSAASEAWVLMGQLMQNEKRRFHAAAAEFDLSMPQVMAMRSLEPGEPAPMRWLAERLMCDNSNVTGIVDRLEARGLVARTPATHDRRVKHLVLTPEGERVRRALCARIDTPPQAFDGLPAADLEALRDIFRRVCGC
jgi:DNA-binding MarR family transcriptional regulator